ncbi:hypothetical protein [Luteolibacter luteus]|uniref:Uncharacterized protein n=1 Tax=Luteolibacter luteus TaxID=2728835 RepID=A0A858RS73_9BACT|nr:hypothetical protein [Luteolibacter luteus]QJE99010.1 hypothetical protein HHL09_25595 [Luteolibacter luteus]
MTSILPPLPLPFPPSLMQSEESSIPVGNLPVSGGTTPAREQRPFSLPPLGSYAPLPKREAHHPERKPSHPPGAPKPPATPEQPDFTDADLAAAILPLVPAGLSSTGFQDDPAFEAILRATFRRALAEHQSGPFQDPDFAHRMLWRFQALFSSRSYEEVLADKIRRFHVEEVYLLDRDRLSLVSYASTDPVRHAHARKVGSFARQLALRVKDESGVLQIGFELGEGRRTVVRPGHFCYLVAVVRGEINDLVKADLDFALRRIESRYRSPFVQGQPLLKELQPVLEECLLIHSPAAPAGN